MSTSLQIRAGVASIAPTGELDMATIGELMQLGELALAQTDTRILRVDFSHVTFMDCSGIASLVLLRQAALAGNQTITVANACARVRKVFDIVGLSATFCTNFSPAADAVEV
jgi:anti-anti-sigma factor